MCACVCLCICVCRHIESIFIYIENHEFTPIPPTPIQNHRVHQSFCLSIFVVPFSVGRKLAPIILNIFTFSVFPPLSNQFPITAAIPFHVQTPSLLPLSHAGQPSYVTTILTPCGLTQLHWTTLLHIWSPPPAHAPTLDNSRTHPLSPLPAMPVPALLDPTLLL